jgi:hypothetical protein
MVVLPVPPLPARAIVYGIFKVFLSIYEGSKVQGSKVQGYSILEFRFLILDSKDKSQRFHPPWGILPSRRFNNQ